jgi:hypothetical protein
MQAKHQTSAAHASVARPKIVVDGNEAACEVCCRHAESHHPVPREEEGSPGIGSYLGSASSNRLSRAGRKDGGGDGTDEVSG